MKQVYLICPVRQATADELVAMQEYVDQLELTGQYKVHFPPRDVDQSNDDGGVRICEQHLEAMACVDEVHVWWNNSSAGSHFDLGMAYMLRKVSGRAIPIVLANTVEKVHEKSFQNVLVEMAQGELASDLYRDSGDRFLEELEGIGADDATGLKVAYTAYGPSWKRRGGVGAFMMLARKWDRLENRVKALGWDLFHAIATDTRREGVIDDVRDLRRYLMLVESEMLARGFKATHRDNS